MVGVIGVVARNWIATLVCGAFAVAVLVLALGGGAGRASAQGGLQLEKRLVKNSNVVQVGERLTFAITITNNWDTTVITLPVVDNYDESVLRFVDATIPPDSHDASTGTLSWDNILATTGPLAVGQQLVVLVRFIAEHPTGDLRVVNAAETHDAYDSLGRRVGDGSSSESGNAVGGSTPLTKTLAGGGPGTAGLPITFTLAVGNDGMADVVSLPIRDVYDPAVLQFWKASPPPSRVAQATGIISWSNALRPPLPSTLAPGEVVTITVVFTALQDIDRTVNRARVVGARDSYGNGLAPAEDEAPIRIVPGPATATRVPAQPRATLSPTAPSATPTQEGVLPTGEARTPTGEAPATPTEVAVATEVATTAPGGGLPLPDTGGPRVEPKVPAPRVQPNVAAPPGLPHAGEAPASLRWLPLAALGLLLLALGLGWRYRSSKFKVRSSK